MPNPASWTVWAFFAILSALTFWKGARDKLVAAHFFTGSAACLAVWMYSLFLGRFAPIDLMGWIILALCVVVSLMWYAKKNAIYANVMLGGVLFLSFLPTLAGVWRDARVEHSLPWFFWTAAYLATTLNVRPRADKTQQHWRLLYVVPVVGVALHGTVALAAAGGRMKTSILVSLAGTLLLVGVLGILGRADSSQSITGDIGEETDKHRRL